MDKLCFIVPYFGKFNNYFPLFLLSCKFNSTFDWLIFTDDNTIYNYPPNVHVVQIKFEEIRQVIQSKFDFVISLDNPYKLCDYKPAYGYIFEEYIGKYKYWGHCDTDVIFGNLSSFLDPILGLNYDKIFCLGHMTIYRNTVSNNRIFMSKYKERYLYKEFFSTNSICWFDEEYRDENNINQIFSVLGKSIYEKDLSLNISQKYILFHRTQYHGISKHPQTHGYFIESYIPSVYVWDNGRLLRYYVRNQELKFEAFPYIHLQGRRMAVNVDETIISRFKIIPNSFEMLFEDVNLYSFKGISKGDSISNILKIRIDNIIKKICRKIH